MSNTKFADALMKALEKKNLEGFDYLEFKQSVTKLKDMGMDESTAIKSAFTTASTMGLTKAKLLKTAKYYAQVLQEEKGQFMRSLEKHLIDNVEGKAKQTATLKKKIGEWEEQIEKLQKQIAKARTDIDSADAKIAQARAKARENQDGFDKALQVITAAIERDIQAINNEL